MKEVMISLSRSGVLGPMESITCWVNSGPRLWLVAVVVVILAVVSVCLQFGWASNGHSYKDFFEDQKSERGQQEQI